MSEFDDLLSKVNLDSLTTYLLYGSEPLEILTGAFDDRVNNAYNTVFKKLTDLFSCSSEKKEPLYNLIVDFASTHCDVYLQTGIILGFQLYKIMESGYLDLKSPSVDRLLKECMSSNEDVTGDIPKPNSLLDDLFEQRINGALELLLTATPEYQHIKNEVEQKITGLDKFALTSEQTKAIDQALSASNAAGAIYGKLAYKQGFEDARNLLLQFLK